jgi:hypothetical protein
MHRVVAIWLALTTVAVAQPYGPGEPVDLEGLPAAFLAVEQEYLARGGSLRAGTEGIGSARLLRDHLIPYANDDSTFYTGLEEAFMERVRLAAPLDSGVRLDPADLYRIGLEVTGGDRMAALLTAHDALKRVGRAAQVGRVGPEQVRPLVGGFYDDYVASRGGYDFRGGDFSLSRDTNALGEAYLSQILQPIGTPMDYTGRYYHLFGTAAANLVGGLGEIAHVVHGRQVNFKRGLVGQLRQARKQEGFWDTFYGYTAIPGVGLLGLLGFGTYTDVDPKYQADLAGAAVGDALEDAPDTLESGASPNDGLPGRPVVSSYARDVLDPRVGAQPALGAGGGAATEPLAGGAANVGAPTEAELGGLISGLRAR